MSFFQFCSTIQIFFWLFLTFYIFYIFLSFLHLTSTRRCWLTFSIKENPELHEKEFWRAWESCAWGCCAIRPLKPLPMLRLIYIKIKCDSRGWRPMKWLWRMHGYHFPKGTFLTSCVYICVYLLLKLCVWS